jgi:chromosome segregation ATPase
MTLNLSIVDVSILFICAVILGVVIHFFITSRRSLKSSTVETERIKKSVDDWKLKYFNEVEVRDKEVSELKNRLSEAEENNHIYEIETEEMRKQQRKMQSDLDLAHRPTAKENKPNYIEELRMAQASLLEHNEKINQLLGNIDVFKENEEKQKLIEDENEGLMRQVKELRQLVSQKESEIYNIRQKESVTKEMTSMLDSAYSEFNTLQSKIQKLEAQLSSSKLVSLEYEDLKEAYHKALRENEEFKAKIQALTVDTQQLTLQLNEAEDKFRDASFQRQQLQKRVGYLEELNSDLQVVADANKKLEHQLKRIGELESMLNVISEENEMLKSQTNQ